MESELRIDDISFKFTEKSDREAFMDVVDRKRSNTPYAHTNCSSEECRKRGNVASIGIGNRSPGTGWYLHKVVQLYF